MSQNANDIESIAYKYVREEIKSVEEALEGARHIIAEWVNVPILEMDYDNN